MPKLLTRHGPRQFEMTGGREDDFAIHLMIAKVRKLLDAQSRLPHGQAVFRDELGLSLQEGMLKGPMRIAVAAGDSNQ